MQELATFNFEQQLNTEVAEFIRVRVGPVMISASASMYLCTSGMIFKL